jgi:hypothetical protein
VGTGIFLFGATGTWGPYKQGLRANGDPRFFWAMMGFWTTFPAFLGDRLEGVFLIQSALRPNGPVKATLRCIEDAGSGETTAMEPFVMYQQVREIAGGGVLRELPVSFDTSPDLPGTDLNRAEATYWKVFFQVPVAGPDFETVFLAPVYERE